MIKQLHTRNTRTKNNRMKTKRFKCLPICWSCGMLAGCFIQNTTKSITYKLPAQHQRLADQCPWESRNQFRPRPLFVQLLCTYTIWDLHLRHCNNLGSHRKLSTNLYIRHLHIRTHHPRILSNAMYLLSEIIFFFSYQTDLYFFEVHSQQTICLVNYVFLFEWKIILPNVHDLCLDKINLPPRNPPIKNFRFNFHFHY